eukprot:9276510-Pyramimonas_sp.AAC.1
MEELYEDPQDEREAQHKELFDSHSRPGLYDVPTHMIQDECILVSAMRDGQGSLPAGPGSRLDYN